MGQKMKEDIQSLGVDKELLNVSTSNRNMFMISSITLCYRILSKIEQKNA